MFNVVFLYSIVQFISGMIIVNSIRKSQPQQYQGFFNGPQNFYQQQQLPNIDSRKWYYSSNQQPLTNSWYWTDQNRPSSNNYRNSLPFYQGDELSMWTCGISQISSRFSRIMGGQDAVPYSYPWMVSLAKRSLNNMHLCGGVLVTRQHVITAAHCMEDFDGPSDLNIIAGIHSTNEQRNPASVISMKTHPQYDPETFANDIAIVTLRSPLPENDPRIGTICLPPDDMPGKSYPPMQISGVATGWGSTYFGGDPSTVLKQVILPILETTKWPCNLYVTYTQGQICAGILSGGADTCQADSGGPLMIENSNNRWEVVGITSFGKSCGKPNTPGIYTRVGTYNSFIRSTIGQSRYNSYSSSTSLFSSLNQFVFYLMFLVRFFLM